VQADSPGKSPREITSSSDGFLKVLLRSLVARQTQPRDPRLVYEPETGPEPICNSKRDVARREGELAGPRSEIPRWEEQGRKDADGPTFMVFSSSSFGPGSLV
jgi:hypothetical protein